MDPWTTLRCANGVTTLWRYTNLGPDLQNILRFIVLKFVVRSTCDSDLQRAKISLRNIDTNTISGALAILQVNRS